MKIRNGFVSNSSSSSFIIRGIRIKKNELAKITSMEAKDNNKLWKMAQHIQHKFDKDFSCEDTRYYFEPDQVTDDVIVGISYSADDGVIFELEDDKERDEKILKVLQDMGIKDAKLSTFFQYVSNDNC